MSPNRHAPSGKVTRELGESLNPQFVARATSVYNIILHELKGQSSADPKCIYFNVKFRKEYGDNSRKSRVWVDVTTLLPAIP